MLLIVVQEYIKRIPHLNYVSGGAVHNLIDDLKKESDKTYLLVAHNGIARIVESYFQDMSNQEFAAFGIQNAEVKEYIF